MSAALWEIIVINNSLQAKVVSHAPVFFIYKIAEFYFASDTEFQYKNKTNQQIEPRFLFNFCHIMFWNGF